MIGIVSSVPTIAIGTIGTPARIAVSTKPPRPNRARRYRSTYGLLAPLAPSETRAATDGRRAATAGRCLGAQRPHLRVREASRAPAPPPVRGGAARPAGRPVRARCRASPMQRRWGSPRHGWRPRRAALRGIRDRCSKLNRNQYRYAGSMSARVTCLARADRPHRSMPSASGSMSGFSTSTSTDGVSRKTFEGRAAPEPHGH